MKRIGKGILVVTVLAVAAILCSVASAGNVNPVTITMEGNSVQGPGIGETGSKCGVLEGTVDSAQEFKFYTNSAWHVEVRDYDSDHIAASVYEEGLPIGEFSGTLILEVGTTTGENTVTKTNREILEAINTTSGDADFDPANWNTNKEYKVVIYFWLYSDDKVGYTYITDTIIFTWDSSAGVWKQSHKYLIWSDGETEIPEFTTIAIPVAGILGLIFLFSRRRKQK